jgi:murein DD-endopeptidase MepM/ murein hydrolase activator NlpD
MMADGINQWLRYIQVLAEGVNKMPEDRPRRTQKPSRKHRNKPSGWQVVAVQSISCVVVILIVVLFKMIGGSAFEQLRQSFNKSIMSNSLMATIAALLETPSEKSETGSSSGSASTVAGESAGDVDSTEEPADNAADTSSGADNSETGAAQTSKTGGETSAANDLSDAAGGNDIEVSERKVFYAPAGATFAPLAINRLPNNPLQNGKITSCFGYRENPLNGEESFHQGLDIAADMNSPVAAMFFGVVTEVGTSSSYGNYITIYHGGGIEALYAHCSKILADRGAVVRAGEIVAQVGSTGSSTGPHLHVEIRVNGIAYDPLWILQRSDYV